MAQVYMLVLASTIWYISLMSGTMKHNLANDYNPWSSLVKVQAQHLRKITHCGNAAWML